MITIYDCIFEWFALICYSRSSSFSSSSLVSYFLVQTGWSRVKSHLRAAALFDLHGEGELSH